MRASPITSATSEMRCQGICSTSSRLEPVPRRLCIKCPTAMKLTPRLLCLHAQGMKGMSGVFGTKQNRPFRTSHMCRGSSEPSYPELEKMVQPKEDEGTEEPIKVVFRDVDTFNLWLWFELYKPANVNDKDLLETLLESWFVVGRMGGFNSMNMQVSEHADSPSFLKYDGEQTETAMQATFMDYSAVEIKGKWCRFWVNMGTADEMSLDVLINTIAVFSRENLGIKQMIVGGVNDDWPVPNKDEQVFAGMQPPPNRTDTS